MGQRTTACCLMLLGLVGDTSKASAALPKQEKPAVQPAGESSMWFETIREVMRGILAGPFRENDRSTESRTGFEHFAKGKQWSRQKEFDKARDEFTRAIATNPRWPAAYVERGWTEYELNNFDAAIADHTRAIEVQPSYAGAFYSRGRAHEAKQDWTAAVKDYDRAIALNPGYLYAYAHRGNVRRELGQYDAALRDYERAIELDPTARYVFVGRGHLRREQKDYAAAIADYTRALELAADARTYNDRAYAKRSAGDFDGAMQDSERSIALEPASASGYLGRGLAKEGRRDYAGAKADFDRAIELHPTDGRPWAHRALARVRLGAFPEALADVVRAIELGDQSAWTYQLRGNVHAHLGDIAAAIADYNRAIELDPDDHGVFVLRARTHAKAGNFSAALADLDVALRGSPKSQTFALRAFAKQRLSDVAGALADYTKALELDPDNVETFEFRAALHLSQKSHAAALADLGRAIELNPTDERLVKRAWVYEQIGQSEAAGEDIAAALRLNPKSMRALTYRAYLASRKGDYAATIADIDAVVAHHGNTTPTETYFQRGWAKVQLKDYAGALDDYSMGLDRDPGNITARYQRADIYARQRDYEAAVRDYTAALDAKPDAAGFLARAEAWAELGRSEAALADFERSIALDDQREGLFRRRGYFFHQRGNLEKAVADYDRALSGSTRAEDYTHFFRLIANRQLGRDEGKGEFAAEISGWKEGWGKTIGRYLAGEIDEAQLLIEADKDAAPGRAERQCEAFYYVGANRLWHGDRAAARSLFEQSVARGITRFVEYKLAQAELKRLRE